MAMKERIKRIIKYTVYFYIIVISVRITLIVLPQIVTFSDFFSQLLPSWLQPIVLLLIVILICLIGTFLSLFLFPDEFIKSDLDKVLNLKFHIAKVIRLWFDWIKWLVLVGTITVVAGKTQDTLMVYIKNISYLLMFLYFFLNFSYYSKKTTDRFIKKLNFKSTDIASFSKFFVFFLSAMLLGLTISVVLFKIIMDWDKLLENFVTKLTNYP